MITHTLTKATAADGGHRRYYVDGQRVSFFTWYQLDQRAVRQDCFNTVRRGNRWLHSKVAHLVGSVAR